MAQPLISRLSWIRFGVKTTAHGMGASPGSIHIMNLENYQVNLHVSTSMEKWGGVGVGTGGICLTNTHQDLSMFLALQIELWARKRACPHWVYRPGILARQMRYRSASPQPCCNIQQWRKCCQSSRIFLLKMWFRQQHQHLLGAY